MPFARQYHHCTTLQYRFDNELQQDSSIKTRDFTSGNKQNQDGVYVFVLNKNGKAEFVKLELSDRTIDHVNNFFRGKYKE